MKRIAALTIVAAALAGIPSVGLAQRSDAADRGQRLDSDALRNDMRQDRLKKPATPLWWWQAHPYSRQKTEQDERKK